MGQKTIREFLAEEAADVEAHLDDPPGPLFRSKRPSVDPSQVYSVRMPMGKLAQLRRLAAKAEINPSSLMRQWILERLEEEASGGRDEKRLRRIIREEVERASRATSG